NGELIQQINPVYVDPRPSGVLDYRAHFFAPTKNFFGTLIDTFVFNLIVIWGMTLVLYGTLYFELLRKGVESLTRFGMSVKNKAGGSHFRLDCRIFTNTETNFKIMRIVSLGLISLLFLWACGSSDRKSEEQDFMQALDSSSSDAPTISEEAIGDILQRIPSPLEISVLLKESGRKYDVGILNDPNNLSKYNTNYKRALNLGVYGTDLGYTNIYEQNQDGLKYIASIKSLADGLNIGQFFDVETIGRLAANSRNLDSLL